MPKKVGLGWFADLRGRGGGVWQERRGGVFEVWLIPQCALYHIRALAKQKY